MVQTSYHSLSLHSRTGLPHTYAPSQHLEHDGDDAARENTDPAVDEDLRQHYAIQFSNGHIGQT